MSNHIYVTDNITSVDIDIHGSYIYAESILYFTKSDIYNFCISRWKYVKNMICLTNICIRVTGI